MFLSEQMSNQIDSFVDEVQMCTRLCLGRALNSVKEEVSHVLLISNGLQQETHQMIQDKRE